MNHQAASSWEMGRRWLVIRCLPRSEHVAAAKARELGFTVLFLHSEYMKAVAKRKPRRVIEAYLPGYIFAVADRRYSLHELTKAHGVQSVLMSGGEYAMIPDTDPVMRQLLKMGDERGRVEREAAKKPITLFKAGETVKIKDGPFALFTAVIESIDEKRQWSWVWVELFGGKVKVQMEIEQLSKAA